VTYSLLDKAPLSKMLVGVSGTTPGPSEHPHKLSKQIVKDLGATTFSLPDGPFYSIPTPCQPHRSSLPRRRSFSTTRLTPCKPSLVPSEPIIIPGFDDLSTTLPTRRSHPPCTPPDSPSGAAPCAPADCLSEPRILPNPTDPSSNISALPRGRQPNRPG